MLFSFAGGGLDPALRLLIDTHARLNGETARRIATYEAVGGALLEAEQPVEMCAGALDSVLARLDETDEASDLTKADNVVQLFPDPLRAVANTALSKRKWAFAAPGVRTLKLDTGGEAQAEILRIQPGHGAPRHTHSGAEITLVLTGAYKDERGRFGVGDVSIADPSVVHKPVAEPGEICYALAVTNAPIRLTGPLGWVQRAIGA